MSEEIKKTEKRSKDGVITEAFGQIMSFAAMSVLAVLLPILQMTLFFHGLAQVSGIPSEQGGTDTALTEFFSSVYPVILGIIPILLMLVSIMFFGGEKILRSLVYIGYAFLLGSILCISSAYCGNLFQGYENIRILFENHRSAFNEFSVLFSAISVAAAALALSVHATVKILSKGAENEKNNK